MKPAEVLREIVYPLTEPAILMAALFFWICFSIAKIAVLFVFPIGIVGAVIIIIWATPACFRYLLFLLEARAEGRKVPPMDAELFGLADKAWMLFPLLLAALLIWGWVVVSTHGSLWTTVYGIAIVALMPASIAVLVLTHSPVESVNPVAIGRMIKMCGLTYLVIPLLVVLAGLSFGWLRDFGAPGVLQEWYVAYLTLMLFTFTGAMLEANHAKQQVDIDPPIEASEAEIARDLERAREKVASHAYGFISRGNREGGFAYILDWIQQEPDVDDASAWFFATMMKWEKKDAALFYAQIYLAHLLHHDLDAKALKLVATCLHTDPAWKPKTEDRQHTISLAEKYQRDDLLKSLSV